MNVHLKEYLAMSCRNQIMEGSLGAGRRDWPGVRREGGKMEREGKR